MIEEKREGKRVSETEKSNDMRDRRKKERERERAHEMKRERERK